MIPRVYCQTKRLDWLDKMMFGVLSSHECHYSHQRLASEEHSREYIGLELGTVRVPGNLSGGKKDQAGTSRHQRRLLPHRRQHLSSEIWVQK